jgi:magnesium transporter
MTTISTIPPEEQRLSDLHEALESGSLQRGARMLNALEPAEIAHLLESLPPRQRDVAWELVDGATGGEVLLYVTDDVRADLLRDMDSQEILEATRELDTDDLADLVAELPTSITREVLKSLDAQRRARLEQALAYPEDSAGGLMNTDTVTVRPEVTLDVVMRYLRRFKEGLPDLTDNLIVATRDGRYLGVLFLADVLTNDPDSSVAEVMTADIQPIPATWDARDVANRFEQHDLVSAPVVDEQGRVLGRITVDDVMDVIREEAEHQFMGQAGLSEDADMFAPVLLSARRRALWLGINLLTAVLASWVIGHFEGDHREGCCLGGAHAHRRQHGRDRRDPDPDARCTRPGPGPAVGQERPLAGGARARGGGHQRPDLGGRGGCGSRVWFDGLGIAAIIAAAMTINLVMAALSGAILPLALEQVGIDPALAGGVILTTVTDVTGFLAFLGLAAIYLT